MTDHEMPSQKRHLIQIRDHHAAETALRDEQLRCLELLEAGTVPSRGFSVIYSRFDMVNTNLARIRVWHVDVVQPGDMGDYWFSDHESFICFTETGLLVERRMLTSGTRSDGMLFTTLNMPTERIVRLTAELRELFS